MHVFSKPQQVDAAMEPSDLFANEVENIMNEV